MHHPSTEITALLQQWSDGDREALDRLVPQLYDQLRRIAHQRLRSEDPGLTLNTTALVHEAYLKLVDVRRLLVDHARSRNAVKRGRGAVAMELDEALCISEEQVEAITELDEALVRLERIDPRQSQILEQRYFGGLSLEETAEVVGLSLATVKRELRFARAWLAAELGGEPGS
jgi:RNA polymerase sigma factor (sigma-70 family)